MTPPETSVMSDEARRLRRDFPYVDECVYLNTASAGLSWQGQGTAAAAFYDMAKSRGINGMPLCQTSAAAVRERLARHVSVQPDEIRFAGSTTEALNLVIGAVRWLPGDEVVWTADEFPSVALACESAGRAGATLCPVVVHAEEERLAAILDALTPATRVVAVSHVHWVTGTRLDLVRLSAACHALGAMLVVDGIQALGAVPVDLGETDVYCASVFKWLLSGFGLAVLVVRERVRAELTPGIRGYNNASPSSDLHYSHVNYPGLYALAACLSYLETVVGWETVHRRVRTLTGELAVDLSNRGFRVITPLDARAGIVSFALPGVDPGAVRDTLAKEGIYVEARGGLMRVSPHFYNTSNELTRFIGAVTRICPRSSP